MFSHTSTTDIPKIKFSPETLKWSTSIKYLGVTIDHKLKFTDHVINSAKNIKLDCTLYQTQESRYH